MTTPNEESPVLLKIDEGIARVTLNRPSSHNALDMDTIRRLLTIIDELKSTPGLRAVVVAGEGESFSSGLDVAGVMADPANVKWLLGKHEGKAHNRVQHLAMGWRELRVPVIAAIAGHAYGGGLQIAMGADFRIAHPRSRLSVMEGRWGIIPDMGLSVTARGRVREDVLMLLAMTAQVLSGEEAHAAGLVTEVAPSPLERADELARSLVGMSPDMVASTKRLMLDSYGIEETRRLAMEEAVQLRLLGSPNQMEAVMARLQKRPPRFVSE